MVDELNTGEELAAVSMMLEVPGRIARELAELVEGGVYLSPEEGLRTWIGAGWRFEVGSYHTLRLDLARDRDADPVANNETRETGAPEQA